MEQGSDMFAPYPPVPGPQESTPVEKTLLLPHITPPGFGLVELVDKKVIIVMRDGRTIIGLMRTFDQFNNVVVQDCFERIVVDKMYCDVNKGTQVFRGENVMIVGEIDPLKDPPSCLIPVSHQEIQQQQKIVDERNKLLGIQRNKFEFFDGE
eukprot:TRINITY_DN559_c0_g2_i3.p2 TRINITY_DN559_c0_g2~~TRINITY_DN559_c0_g2_i3.p2  ORF type:complete len:170 (-),score=31.95 TRINITY_DN559_c0_g2_i3:187-642(-)